MVVTTITDYVLFGSNSDTKPLAGIATNTLFFEIDTGRVYKFTGGVWSLFSGDNKPETLTNKTLTTPIISSIKNGSSGATINIPTTSDTLVGRSTTDTLSNKTLLSPTIATINNGGVITLPSGTRTLMARDTSDTVLNKTINVNSNSITATSQATGDILINNGTQFVRLPRGTNGQVLSSTATSLAWTTASSGSSSTRQGADYVVYNTGSGYAALNCATGSVDFTSSTDAGAVINSCINALQPSNVSNAVDKKGKIKIGPGTYTINTTITTKNHFMIEGAGMAVTLLELGNNVNIDMFKSIGFAALTGTNNAQGNVDVTIRDLSMSGTAWNNLTAGCGIRKYGFAWLLENVEIKNFREQGIYTEWCTSGGTSYADDDVHEQQEQWRNVQFFKNFGGGVLHRGPHDSTASNCSWAGNTGYGLKIEHSASVYTGELHLHHCHVWDQNGTNSRGVWVAGGKLHFTDLIIETVDAQNTGGIGLYADGGVARGSYLWVFGCDMGVNLQNPGPCSLHNVLIENNTTGIMIEGNDHYITGKSINNNNVGNTAGVNLTVGKTGTAVTRNYIQLQLSGAKTTQMRWLENNWDNFIFLQVYNTSGQRTVIEDVPMNLASNCMQVIESGSGTNTGWGRPMNETNIGAMYNKTIDATLNNMWDVIVSPHVRRIGQYIPTSGNTATTVGAASGMLGGYTPTGAGTNSNTYDTTEGSVLANLATTTTAGQNAGLVSPTVGVGMGRRLISMRVKIRFKIDAVASGVSRFYFGFSSAALSISDNPLAATDNGFIVGYNSTDTSFQIWSNDGATSVTKTAPNSTIAKDTNFHTIEIAWPANGSITVVIDNTYTTISSDLPATTANLFFNAVVQNVTAAARTISIKAIYIEEGWK